MIAVPWFTAVSALIPRRWKILGLLSVTLTVLGVLLAFRATLIARNHALMAAHDAAARADTVRILWRDSTTVLVARLASYSDSIADLRHRTPRAGTATVVTRLVALPAPEAQHDTVRVPALPDSLVVTLRDSLLGPPVRVDAAVTLAHGDAMWDLVARPFPITLTIDAGCLARFDPDVKVLGPVWLRLDTVRTHIVDKNFCGAVAPFGVLPRLGIGGLLMLLGMAIHALFFH